jgi:post-segregation antitoxin (ccd killing protein)
MQTQEGSQLEQALADALKKQQCKQWLADNSEAVNVYNGVFSDLVRSF